MPPGAAAAASPAPPAWCTPAALGGSHHLRGAPIGIILLYFIAGKVRKSNKVTVPEIMEARYGKAASIISALCVMLAYVGVLATQLKAAADIIVLLCSSSGVEISTAWRWPSAPSSSP